MGEPKNRQVMVYLEDTFYDIMQRVAGKDGGSASGYIRNLIISDLSNRGLVTESILTAVLTGRSITEDIKQKINAQT